MRRNYEKSASSVNDNSTDKPKKRSKKIKRKKFEAKKPAKKFGLEVDRLPIIKLRASRHESTKIRLEKQKKKMYLISKQIEKIRGELGRKGSRNFM